MRRRALAVVAGAVLLVGALMLLQVASVLLVHDQWTAHLARSQWLYAVLSVAGGDVALGALLVLFAGRRLARPVMPETRVLLRKTLAAMTES